MQGNQGKVSSGGAIVLLLTLSNAIILERAMVAHPALYKLAAITVPLMLIGMFLHRRDLF